jgi:hypothetical protein
MLNRIGFLLLLAFGLVGSCLAQNLFEHPDEDAPFNSESLPSIYIECGDALAWMFQEDNWYSNVEHPATFTFVSAEGTEVVEEVGFRLRGNTSRAAAKKSFKIAFNSFDSDVSWHGLKKLNLNGEHNEPSTMRARLVWESFRDAGIPVSRSTHCKLFINGDYYGVYLSSEHINGRWLDRRFPWGHGNLWKCTYPADLAFISDDPDDYKFTPDWSDQRVYELKTNESQDDYSALASFIDALNNSTDEELPCALEAVFDVEGYLKVMAGEILVGHWDNYVGNKNNFYLYQRSFDNRLMYLPYDVDNTLGIQWFGEWTTQDPYAWTDSDNRPLYSRILDNDGYRDRFSWYLNWWMENWLTADWAMMRGEWLQSLLSGGIEQDVFYGLDYGFTPAAFASSLTDSWGGHVAHGIVPFIESRNDWAEVQLESYSGTPDPTLITWAKGPVMNDTLLVQAWGHEAQNPEAWSLSAFIEFPDGSSASTPMTAVTNQNHGIHWKGYVPMNGAPFAHWQILTTAPSGTAMQSPCLPRKIWNSIAANSIVINEVMAKNSAVLSDSEGDYQDWVELYNAGNEAINLESFFLSNRWSDPSRWAIPSVTMDPGDHLLIWCDDESTEGPLHSSFTLDALSDELFLFQQEDNAWRLHDSIGWENSPENDAYGRSNDGSDQWIWFEHLSLNPPTPDAPNGTPVNVAEFQNNAPEEIWHSHAASHTVLKEPAFKLPFYSNWKIWSNDGKVICDGQGYDFQCSQMGSGLFLFEYYDQENNLHGSLRFICTNQ